MEGSRCASHEYREAVVIDAVSDALVACEIPSIADAIDEARSRNANEIWQQNLDVRGLPSGKPFRLQRKS